jgi:hypothetical protein
MSYESPIQIIQGQLRLEQENGVYKAVLDAGVIVDKDELLKALKYDRGQYEEGYRDGSCAYERYIVHCCECNHCKTIIENGRATWHCKKAYGLPEVDPADYCSRAERREEDND